MDKYVFYQTNKSVWLVKAQDYNRYCYENEFIPIRYTVAECTNEAIEKIYEIFNSDKELFKEIIQEELQENDFTYYNN